MTTYYTYILRLSNNPSTGSGQAEYYVGSTINLRHRIQEHNEGLDFYTKSKLPVNLVYFEEYPTQEEAYQREKQLKGWSRLKKEKLISGEWTKQ